MNNNMEKEIFDIYIDDIIPNRFQPRLLFDEKSLNELADSIKQHGIIQPLVLRKVGDKYEIIAGERRYKASQIAGLKKVPAVIMNLDDKQSAEVAVVENIQRRDLSALEEAESYKKLLDKGYLTQEQLATRMGKAQATISNKLRLLGLDDEVKEALLNEKISERHARSLLSLKNPVDQRRVLNDITNNKLTVRQTDELIKTMLNESVETLDFNNVPNGLPPTPIVNQPVETPIPTPVNHSFEPIMDPIVIPQISSNIPFVEIKEQMFDPISSIDVDKIKEQALDINPIQDIANVDALLSAKQPPITPVIPLEPIKEVQMSRFITSLDDDQNQDEKDTDAITLMNNQDLFISPSIEESNQPPMQQLEVNTYNDSLVQEFRQQNAPIEEKNKIIAGDLRSAINIVRDTTQLLEQNNFKVSTEEFDFEHLYQIIIKINK